jgi:hypothetical protein
MDLFRPGVAPAVREPVPARPLQVPDEADRSQVSRQAQRLQGCHAVGQDQVTAQLSSMSSLLVPNYSYLDTGYQKMAIRQPLTCLNLQYKYSGQEMV